MHNILGKKFFFFSNEPIISKEKLNNFTKTSRMNLPDLRPNRNVPFHFTFSRSYVVKYFSYRRVYRREIDFQWVSPKLQFSITQEAEGSSENFPNADSCNFRFCRDFCLRHGTMTRRKPVYTYPSILLGFIREFPVNVTHCLSTLLSPARRFRPRF